MIIPRRPEVPPNPRNLEAYRDTDGNMYYADDFGQHGLGGPRVSSSLKNSSFQQEEEVGLPRSRAVDENVPWWTWFFVALFIIYYATTWLLCCVLIFAWFYQSTGLDQMAVSPISTQETAKTAGTEHFKKGPSGGGISTPRSHATQPSGQLDRAGISTMKSSMPRASKVGLSKTGLSKTSASRASRTRGESMRLNPTYSKRLQTGSSKQIAHGGQASRGGQASGLQSAQQSEDAEGGGEMKHSITSNVWIGIKRLFRGEEEQPNPDLPNVGQTNVPEIGKVYKTR